METPERSKSDQGETSIGKFEDSPIFSFINNLSPIKPVKSTHISQTISPLAFASLPSVFTSPQVNPLRESRLLPSPQPSDPSKHEFSCTNAITVDANKENEDDSKKPEGQKENLEPECETPAELSDECSKLVAEFVENINRDCRSPESHSRPNSCARAEHEVFAGEGSQRRSLCRSGVSISQVNSKFRGIFIPDSADLFTFESQTGIEFDKKPVDPATSFYARIKNAVQNMHSTGAAISGDQVGVINGSGNLSARHGEESEIMENDMDTHDVITEKMDYEQFSGFYRGVRRRCLVFETPGGTQRHLEDNSGSDSSLLLQAEGNTCSSQQLVLATTENDLSHHALPGIGLHLNALAATPKGYKIVNHEALSSGRLLIGHGLSSVNFLSHTSGQALFENDAVENGILTVEDPCGESRYMLNEEINQSFPKKKRRRLETAGDGESCKRCNCKKSKCLKLYCECFAAGVYCVEPCACIDCFNKPAHEDTVLATRKQIESRNPLAFAPKVIRTSDSSSSETKDDFSKTPASARHKRGCNCKKSGCLKKYCECYQGGVGCSINCRCEGCKNTFGRKNGSGGIGMDTESEEDEADANEKAATERPLKRAKTPNNINENMDSVPPKTPSNSGRQVVQSFSSKKKLPRYSFPSICSSSEFSGFRISSFFPSLPKFDQKLETVREEDVMPEFLQGVLPPIGSVNSSSPNRKRVSPPQRLDIPSSSSSSSPAGLRSSRKLILQSIPSFPSLASNQ